MSVGPLTDQTEWFVVDYQRTGGNGIRIVTLTEFFEANTGNSNSWANQDLSVGQDQTETLGWQNGQVAEILLYNRGLTAANRECIEQSLLDKWVRTDTSPTPTPTPTPSPTP